MKRLSRAAPRRDLDTWLRPIDGAFALALPGERPDELLALTDRLGTIHLYRAHAGPRCYETWALGVGSVTSGLVASRDRKPGIPRRT